MHLPTSPLRAFTFLLSIALSMSLWIMTGLAEDRVEFNRDVLPILSDKCFACHGPDANRREADLRLDQRDSAIDSGAILPNHPSKSTLMDRVQSLDASVQMPPPESKLEPLTEREIKILSLWIEQGAEYQLHWAFLPAKRSIDFGDNPSAGIDRIVLRELKKQNRGLQPEADGNTLIRRLSFDLTGLPPTQEEVEAFLRDSRQDAYERLVDRLLASPHYGERMAVDWLDVARYADSFGFQVDREWEMWQWRDWVISAFNENLPFDQFMTWQLAGDLLPNPTPTQRLATAFNRLHQQESEGGSVEEEYRVEYVCDRVQTFSTAFLGLTFECARCHDHKFDPLTQRDYYQLFSLFQNIDEAGLYSYFTGSPPTPTVWLPDAKTQIMLDEKRKLLTELEEQRASLASQQRGEFETWLASLPFSAPSSEQPPPSATETPVGWLDHLCLAHFDFNHASENQFENRINPAQKAILRGENRIVPGVVGTAIEFTGDDPVDLPLGNFPRHEPFSLSLWVKASKLTERAVILHRSRAWTDAASRGYELLLEDGKLKWSLIHFWPGNAISIRAVHPIEVDRWTHVVVTYDGSSRVDGLSMMIDGRPAVCETIKSELTKDITGGGGDNIALGERFRDRGFRGGCIDELYLYHRVLLPMEAYLLSKPSEAMSIGTEPSRAFLMEPGKGESAAFDWFLAHRSEKWKAYLKQLQDARQAYFAIQDSVKELMAMRELPDAKPAYILVRGEYNQRGDLVEPGTPSALGPFPEGVPRNRLGLAQWLANPEHPLMARVTVNRVWQTLFGRGLVPTSEDFGNQGARPRYPEILDGLAWHFSHGGWDMRRLVKDIVMSQTYRQRSTAELPQMQEDPDNEWLARGPRYRLPAEMIRDNALTLSGLLNRHVGGPPVNPYEMAEAFKPVGASPGSAVHRRSLYTNWRRTSPPPALLAFDAPRRAVCIAKRERTDSPLQALILLNGIQYVEAARSLAEQVYMESPNDLDTMLNHGCMRCLSRLPDATEMGILKSLYGQQLARFERTPEAAKQLLSVGTVARKEDIPVPVAAALTVVMQTLMNHDACVVKR